MYKEQESNQYLERRMDSSYGTEIPLRQVVILLDKNAVRYESFLEWDGLWCSCCENRIRTKSRQHQPPAIQDH